MKRFYQRKSFRVLLLVLAILLALLIHTVLNGSYLLGNFLGLIATPMQRVSAETTEAAAELIAETTVSYNELKAQNEALQSELNQLRQQMADYYDVKQENQELRNYLELKSENPDYQMVYASVVARDGSDLYYSFRVDQGSLAGVSVGDPVVTEEGLVGWVSSVGTTYSSVTTILSPETNIAAMDKVSRDSGMVTATTQLSDAGLIRLSYLESDKTVQAGDMVVTSGIGGKFPKNLLIGKVVEVRSSELDVSFYATIEPYADYKNCKNVVILTEFAGQGEALPAASGTEESGA